MAWDHLAVNRPHLVYIILGGFTSLFMLCSSFIKERLYIGEATVATICGVIFGPHAANLINPGTWGNTDQVTLEFSRIVLVVQCFAVGVELPKYYMEKHWRSVVFLLIPVMTFGWLITSLFIWWMIPPLNWLESLCCAACVTATDPVLASSVVGKGKFAKRVPKHLRDLLSAESGCNDGMAFPFIYLALYLIEFRPDKNAVSFHWIVITILYECIFGAFYGFMIGYIGRHGIKYAEKHDLVDRESFLVFYFVLALFCAGSGSILGVDDLLVGFAAGVGFSNDGWFTQKTEESHVSNVIDLLLNLAYFVYLGTIIPWEMYNDATFGMTPWRLVVIAIFVIFFRRIPIMMALKPLIPDIKTWREGLFAGHFGPIGVGAIFVAILARAELETKGPTPLASYADPSAPHYTLVSLIWPITTFLVISSIIVHGSSIAVFTLGKHINTLTLTMSYTQAGDEGPGWLNRLPRITSTASRSQAKSTVSETDLDELKIGDVQPGSLLPIGLPREFLRRQKEEENQSHPGSRTSSIIPRRRKKKWDDGVGPGGPISQSAIYPQRRSQSANVSEQTSDTLTPGDRSPEHDEKNEVDIGDGRDNSEMRESPRGWPSDEKGRQRRSGAPDHAEIYDEGDHIIIENEDGEVLAVKETPEQTENHEARRKAQQEFKEDIEHPSTGYKNLRKKIGIWRGKDEPAEDSPLGSKSAKGNVKRGPALAYQFGNTIIVEDEDGEVVKTYELPAAKPHPSESKVVNRMGAWAGMKKSEGEPSKAGPSTTETPPSAVRQGLQRMGTWGFGGKSKEETPADAEDDDRHIRFMIGGAGRRLTKDDFIREIQQLDPKARNEIVSNSDAPDEMKDMAEQDASPDAPGSGRLFGAVQHAGKGVVRRGDVVKEESDSDDDFSPAQIQLSRRPSVGMSKVPSNDIVESEVERKRREHVLKGVADVAPERRGRTRSRSADSGGEGPVGEEKESAAEKRRREAALGLLGAGDDSEEDDGTIRVPPPVAARSRGIRFAQSPVRGREGRK